MPGRVAVVGAVGYGRWHLANIARLDLRLVGICDVRPVDAPAPVYQDLNTMLAECAPDITVVATPIHTHAAIAETVLRAGSAVLLEKPPVTSLADLDRLQAVADKAGLPVEVGFQAMGSGAVRQARTLVGNGTRGIGAFGAWQRTSAYYGRARWAGKRSLDGVPVVDGALSNPFAHALMNALWIAGVAERAAPKIELELFRANDIEADDTSCVRVTFPDAPTVVVAGTLCAETNTPAAIQAHGPRGTADLRYEQDVLDGERFDRVDQLANLAAGGDPLCPLATTRCFTSVIEAIRDAPDPTPIDPRYWREVAEPDGTRRVVSGVDEAVRRSANELVLFTEQGIVWKGRT
ncbi:Gfo/Idh/MocA family protein [Actinocrispum wychmicini]|uniref:Putative dehydrogenase n=1 Tax=Actinocrispum wychmicini TaxID=1213861 RepID=A0A4R2JAZ3_9PSEU|nr:Gfo/Idh/MocA family oxidoreductase [Actinocrispum wychmicini]TCO56633.1 putative dehydrogenase [Actinocrispum wychmicini]